MKENEYVLAMYDIRGKQAFIYRSNSIKEIAGGSLIIRDCFSTYLHPAAKTIGKGKGIFQNKNIPFTREGFRSHLDSGYIGEVVYDGGGNYIVIFRDEETYRSVNYEFSKRVLKEIGTLQILPTCIRGVDFDDYPGDNARLYSQHRIDEGKQSFIPPYGTLPIVQVDYATSEPLVCTKKIDGAEQKLTLEREAKVAKFFKARKENDSALSETVFDNMVQERGRESLLAVIYADGNNMGAKVQEQIRGLRTYEDCIRTLREFSESIQRDYIDDRQRDIDKYLVNKYGDNAKRRYVIGSGDEITFICNARYAYEIMNLYLNSLPEGCSSCAGAAIFHSHSPYSEAYRIAEECCESGKKYMKKHDIRNGCFMDFYYCQGAIGTSLEEIRAEEVGELVSKPWRVAGEGIKAAGVNKDVPDTDLIEECRRALNIIGRSNVKGLAGAAKEGDVEYILELKRIRAHMGEKRKQIAWDTLAENRALIYDMVIVYDIWFDISEEAGKEL